MRHFLQDDAVGSAFQEIDDARKELLERVEDVLQSAEEDLTERQQAQLESLRDGIDIGPDHEDVDL